MKGQTPPGFALIELLAIIAGVVSLAIFIYLISTYILPHAFS